MYIHKQFGAIGVFMATRLVFLLLATCFQIICIVPAGRPDFHIDNALDQNPTAIGIFKQNHVETLISGINSFSELYDIAFLHAPSR